MNYDASYDVVVAGGGIAGVAAAVQAARMGKKTAIVEKTILFGGLATTGLIYIYLPICDGNGRQVTFGLSEELLQRSMRWGPGQVSPHWREGKNAEERKRYRCAFAPGACIMALDEILEESGVDVWLDTLICDAETDGKRVTAIVCENKSGRGRLRAKCFVDATGDADVLRRAGVPCHDAVNFLSIWEVQYDAAAKNDETELGDRVRIRQDGVPWDVNDPVSKNGGLFRGLTGKNTTEFVLKGRRMLRDYYRKARAEGKSREDFYCLAVPAMPQFRKTYALDAAYVLDTGENNRHFPDSIGLVADWRQAGPVWEVPYRALYPANKFGGVLAAGRCAGSRGDAWEVTRVIPVAAMTGQVAGLAAAMTAETGIEPADLDVSEIQKRLRALGFAIHLADVGL